MSYLQFSGIMSFNLSQEQLLQALTVPDAPQDDAEVIWLQRCLIDAGRDDVPPFQESDFGCAFRRADLVGLTKLTTRYHRLETGVPMPSLKANKPEFSDTWGIVLDGVTPETLLDLPAWVRRLLQICVEQGQAEDQARQSKAA